MIDRCEVTNQRGRQRCHSTGVSRAYRLKKLSHQSLLIHHLQWINSYWAHLHKSLHVSIICGSIWECDSTCTKYFLHGSILVMLRWNMEIKFKGVVQHKMKIVSRFSPSCHSKPNYFKKVFFFFIHTMKCGLHCLVIYQNPTLNFITIIFF